MLTEGYALRDSALIHGEIMQPPQLALITPTGTSRAFESLLAKKYATALKRGEFCGLETCHSPSASN